MLKFAGIGKIALAGAIAIIFASAALAADDLSFKLETHYAVPDGGLAEIVTASPDGRFLYYTNASGKKIGALDISDPSKPKPLAEISTGEAEPTSAAVSKDGKYLVAVLRNGDGIDNPAPGTLRLFSIGADGAPEAVGDAPLGVGPDSLALTEVGGKLVAVVAIEDEETDSEGEATIDGKRPGQVDVVTVNAEKPEESIVATVNFSEEALQIDGVNFPQDPQPEFVAISPDGLEAAVTLQENNAVALIDLKDPAKPAIKSIFTAGTVSRKADLKKDGNVDFSSDFTGRREPDAAAYLSIGGKTFLALANEGDSSLKTFGDGVYSGGRGVSLHNLDGSVVWDSGLELENAAALSGHYPDARSESRSMEVEGVAVYSGLDRVLMVAASEKGSFLAVYQVNDAEKPELLALLPTGNSPEGVKIAPGRSDGEILIISGNEGDGTINIYSASTGVQASSATPRITSESVYWTAISGMATDGEFFYAVGDNAVKPSVIWKIYPSKAESGEIAVLEEIHLTKDGQAQSYDLEGICWTKDGFWLSAEAAKTASENLLVFSSLDGQVQAEYPLDEALIAKYGDPQNYGFEGVAAASGGEKVYAVLQRGFDSSKPQAAILEFAPASREWRVAWYPLDQNSIDQEKYWTGLSDVALGPDSKMLVVERDKGAGSSAEVKKIYSIDLDSFGQEKTLEKALVSDIAADWGLLLEKVASLALLNDEMWIVTDNDGAGWTRVINLGAPGK